jgi:tetratricopeptide (TPR) repeat protein
VCAVAAVGAMVVGYARTAAALRLAARNAEVADAALGEVFHHVENMLPSKRDTKLLSALLPYYGRLAGNQELPQEKVAEVNGILGVCAFRSGDFELAEKAFRRLVEIHPSPTSLNRLAETLRRRGRTEEAAAVAQRVADGYARTTNVVDRYEAALAFEWLSHQKGREIDRKLAFALAKMVREAEPANPDFRFLYARLLAESPNLESPTNRMVAVKSAFVLLSDLATEYPDRPEYGKELVTAMDRRLRNGPVLKTINRTDVELALDTADRLLGRYPNVPEIVSAVVAFRDTYAIYLRRLGDLRTANRESLRTTGMLELLSHNPETPDAVRHTFNGKSVRLPYRQVTTGTDTNAAATLILALHDRSLNGSDNVRQTTVPFLRTLVTYAEKRDMKAIILLPQCPGGREGNWLGSRKGRRDGLLADIASLVQVKTNEFNVATERTFVVGVDSGGDACWPLLANNTSLFARALVAGAAPVPASAATNITAAVRIVHGESDRLHSEASVRKAAARIGGENGPSAEVDLQLGSTHKTVIDNAFSDDALEWLMNAQEDVPPFPPSETLTPAYEVFGTDDE